MIEDAYEVLDYLPYSFKTTQERDYVDFLWNSFESNYRNAKFQFASIAFHMLFMSGVYFDIWKIKVNNELDFKKALIGFTKDDEKNILNATSPFVFSKINEKQIFRFLKLIKCENCHIGNYSRIVQIRNSVAHSNGNVYFSAQQSLDDHIREILRALEEINEHTHNLITDVLQEFLLDSWNSEEREYPDNKEQIEQMLVQKNYFSKRDIQFCLEFDIKRLQEKEHYIEMNSLFDSFKSNYADIAT